MNATLRVSLGCPIPALRCHALKSFSPALVVPARLDHVEAQSAHIAAVWSLNNRALALLADRHVITYPQLRQRHTPPPYEVIMVSHCGQAMPNGTGTSMSFGYRPLISA